MQIELTFYGVRGTRPVSGRRFEKFGGDTSCVGVRVVPEQGEEPIHLLFDGGTGIQAAGEEWAGGEHPVTIFLSHLHHDHVGGFAFFAPLFEAGRSVRVYAPEGMADQLRDYFAPPYYPLTMDDLPANVHIIELPPDGSVQWRSGDAQGTASMANGDSPVSGAVVVHSLRLPGEVHPRNGVTLYAVEAGNKRIVYASDFEWHRASAADQSRVLDFMKGADVLVVDAQYTEAEYEAFAGRGHNTVSTAVKLGEQADVGHMFLFHHDPNRDDGALEALEEEAQGGFRFPGQTRRGDRGPVIKAARQGMRLTLRVGTREGGGNARTS